MKTLRYSFLAVLTFIATLAVAEDATNQPWRKPDPAAMKHWQDMRFGMFIHWGPVSLTGHEIGWSRGAQTPIAKYDSLYKEFNPTKFNADEWVSIAKAAGKKKGENNRKNGNKYLAWAYVEAACFAQRFSPRAQAWFARKTARTCRVVALKALACKLSKAAYYVLRDAVDFDENKLFG